MKKMKSIMYRSSRTGLAVTKKFAKSHPATTVKETNKRRKSRKKKRKQRR